LKHSSKAIEVQKPLTRKGNKMRIRITNLDTFDSYEVNLPSQARDATDRSAAELAVQFCDIITMGKVVAEPADLHMRGEPIGLRYNSI
jgi:hypothetical protein